jgi:methylated-DNA-[protein]-cysteine S-methyltransferase
METEQTDNLEVDISDHGDPGPTSTDGRAKDVSNVSMLMKTATQPNVDPCDVACEAMPGYVIGDLGQPDRSWVDQHTLTCNYCRNELTGFRKLNHLLNEYESDIPMRLQPPDFRGGTRPAARYGKMDSPVGPLLIAVSENGIVEIAYARGITESIFLHQLKERGFDPVPDIVAVDPVIIELEEYFHGDRNVFDLAVDLTGLSPFFQDVLRAVARVPFGSVATYKDIAESVGNPGAARAVGNAMNRNPIPIVLPCHRIVPADHSIGKYGGGVDVKIRLLNLEGAAIAR